MDEKVKKLRIKEIDDRVNNLNQNIDSMKRKIKELTDRKHQLLSEKIDNDGIQSEIYSLSENLNKEKQEYLRQKNLINGKISSLKKTLKDLEIKYWKKELDDKIRNVSENYSNLVTLDQFKSIRRGNSPGSLE
ncbi:MAG: hypothetical protein ABR927_12750 [Bacteroidales bacterium]|jgi:SMC interacting uncharacterized protein involved in chromosome segregation